MKKLKDLLNETINPELGKVYSDPYAKSFVKENENEESSEMTTEQKHAFLEAVKAYKSFGETVYRNEGLSEVYESIRGLVDVAGKNMVKETEGSFDGITVSRHVKRMNESFKVFEKTLREVATLQQRLESSYDEIGETLGKYYEINESEEKVEEGNEFGAERAKAIANGDSEFKVDGKTYPLKSVDKDDKENAKEFTKESMKLTDILKEARDVGHYERVGNQTIVDSNFVNYSKGVLPNSELVHLGMGDFAIKSKSGTIKFQRSGKMDGIGQDFVGRPHRMTDDKNGKLVDLFLKLMLKKKKAIISMSESVVNEKEGVKHYTKDGKEWTGPTHKMPNGTLMTQNPHSDDSEKLFHKEDLDESVNEAQKVNSTSKKFLKGMKKIKVKGLGGWMPGVDYVYVDGNKYYFVDFQGDHMELKNIGTIKQLHKLYGSTLGESVNEDKFAGWIAGYNGKKIEIKKGEAKDLYNAKLLAIKKLKVPKSKVGLMFIKPAVDESVVNEAKYDIGMARKGNGLTIYNKAEEENGDYKNVALIDNKGKIKYLDKKVPSNIKKQIEDEAKKMMEITNEGNSMIKLKNLMNESIGLGELPSEKLMKMKVSAKDMLDSVNPKKVNESEEDESRKRLDSINKIRQALSKTKDLKRAEFGFLDDVKAKRLLLSLIDHLEKQVKVLSK